MIGNIIIHGGEDRQYRLCERNKCKTVAECTPIFDFYTLERDGEKPPVLRGMLPSGVQVRAVGSNDGKEMLDF